VTAGINNVVILFFENHTLDNVASEISGAHGDPALPVIQLPAPPHDYVIPDPAHGHPDWLKRSTGARAQRFTRSQLPNLMALMDQYCLCDNYFSDYAGNSFPNHCFAIGADAEWAYRNPNSSTYKVVIQEPGLPKRLAAAGKTWANYGPGFAFDHYADPVMRGNKKKSDDFISDAGAGALPNVSWVYGPAGQDFHPGDPNRPRSDGSSMSASDQWLGKAVQAIASGPHWRECMVFVTFDDWGGWADHVAPDNVEQFPAGTPYAGDQYRYGSRVPCIVVGPYAKPKHVSPVRSSHVSLVAFIERLWGLPPSGNADARRRTTSDQALVDCYDLNQAPNPAPVLSGLAAPPAPASGGKRG
jgi:phospholipase C